MSTQIAGFRSNKILVTMQGAPNEIQIMDKSNEKSPNVVSSERSTTTTSTQYVLNIAFFSFVIFCILEIIFALLANSHSMLADAQAMSIDAMSYLFNMGAEYLKKNRPLSSNKESSLCLTPQEQRHARELRRLYLELIPPAISVVVLISVTVSTLVQAFNSLWGKSKDIAGGGDQDDEDVSIELMLIFSAANMLLDILNVTCFARAKANYGLGDFDLPEFTTEEEGSLLSLVDENDKDAASDATNETTTSGFSHYGAIDSASISSTDDSSSQADDTMTQKVNLNMCSAWTHVCADTMRTIAVLIAASIAMLFPEQVDGKTADDMASVAVSVIILISLVSLIHGLFLTAISIRQLHRCKPTLPPKSRHAMIIKEIMV